MSTEKMPTLPDSPSLASYHLECHASSPIAFHSALYLRMGTPPVASGSSNCTCAVLEYGSTRSMDGEEGVSVGRTHRETQVSPVWPGTITPNHKACLSHFCSLLGILSPVPCPPGPPPQLTLPYMTHAQILQWLSASWPLGLADPGTTEVHKMGWQNTDGVEATERDTYLLGRG